MNPMPVLFGAHGNPMNALEKNAFSICLQSLGQVLPKPQAILCVSAHWETQGTHILNVTKPATIHDFFGFPKALFDIQYSAPGSKQLAKKIHDLVPDSLLNEKWGLDHGTWSLLVHMYPNADIPVLQLSIDQNKTLNEHLELGRKLQPLRQEGVLILGSGNIVHNLALINWKSPHSGLDWAKEFDQGIKKALDTRDTATLLHFENQFPQSGPKSVPTLEHYIPLLYCVGASTTMDAITYPYEGYELGSLSMRSVLFRA